MSIRRPTLSVSEARRLANINSALPGRTVQMPALPDSPREPGQHPERAVAPSFASPPSSASISSEQLTKPDRIAPQTVIPREALVGQQAKTATVTKQTKVKAAAPPYSSTVQTLDIEAEVNKVQVFVSALRPAPGVSITFDMLRDRYQPAKALQMILRRALQEYDELLLSGKFLQHAQTYDFDPDGSEAVIQTSRMMPKSSLAIARAHFDPLELESTRAFGRKLAVAALSAYFSAHAGKENPVRKG